MKASRAKGPAINAQASDKIEVFRPETLAALLKSPHEFTPSKLLDAISNERAKQVFSELYSSTGDLTISQDDNLPDWARKAWQEFWRSLALFPDAKHASEAKQTGHSLGLLAGLPSDSLKGPLDLARLHELLLQTIPGIRSEAAQLPHEDAADFFNAQRAGHRRAAQLQQISQRTKIYLLIALAWREVATLKSTSELYQWLCSVGKKGQPLIAAGTDSRDIRYVCKRIGLRYGSRGGRPRKKTR